MGLYHQVQVGNVVRVVIIVCHKFSILKYSLFGRLVQLRRISKFVYTVDTLNICCLFLAGPPDFLCDC